MKSKSKSKSLFDIDFNMDVNYNYFDNDNYQSNRTLYDENYRAMDFKRLVHEYKLIAKTKKQIDNNPNNNVFQVEAQVKQQLYHEKRDSLIILKVSQIKKIKNAYDSMITIDSYQN